MDSYLDIAACNVRADATRAGRGDLEVQRRGHGAMRRPGEDAPGEPDEPARARSVLRRAVDLGITFIDPAWSVARRRPAGLPWAR